MPHFYRVKWEIDIYTECTPEEAAREALRIQRDPTSIATVFDVTNCDNKVTTRVDLDGI